MKALSEEFRQRSKSQSNSGPGGGATASNPSVSVTPPPPKPSSQPRISSRGLALPVIAVKVRMDNWDHTAPGTKLQSLHHGSCSTTPTSAKASHLAPGMALTLEVDYGSSDEYGSSPSDHTPPYLPSLPGSSVGSVISQSLDDEGANYILMGQRSGGEVVATAIKEA
ncbi:unnamed protein product [Pleuronectes platessa]|uniref:Uncharacterized protein n=1 Tax=Pleuronectes platessa TaxID=8262 RepID=A0A9N7YCB7_PLEPL|nr:unnamed protein product [Pleuronectes platessa]